ncbi:protein kinase domain-containing protein [Paractinoplanes durhamensis]|uniref:protein kinase domain-containing protein n=1 Tax=Paractinoplanes durhamensis TaxID=113563 RepID=UPI00364429A3
MVEFVDGPSLADVVREQGSLSAANVHGVAIGVATALVAIHGAGIIHRDLKPANVLFKLGTPKVIDFGIARATDPTSEHTRPDQLVGTIAYMAPERFDPAGRRVTPAADVFAWGVVVTYAATGHLPFAGDSPMATAGMILTQPPNLTGLTGGLRDLVESALDKDPARRPAAAELLDRLLAVEPADPEVRRAAHAARDGVRARRNTRRMFRLTAAVLVLTVAAGVPSGLMLREREADRGRAVAAVQAARVTATGNLVAKSKETRRTDPGLSLRLAATAVGLTPEPTTRDNLAAAIATGYAGELPVDESVWRARYRPDGRVAVLLGGDGTLTFWAGTTVAGTLRTGAKSISDMAFSPDGRILAVLAGRLQLWDVHDLSAPHRLDLTPVGPEAEQLLEFSPGRIVLSGGKYLAMWDVRDPTHPRNIWRTTGPNDWIGPAAVNSAHGLYAAVTGDDLAIWSATGTAKPGIVARIKQMGVAQAISINPAGTLAAIVTAGDRLRLYDLSARSRPRRLEDPPGAPVATAVAFSPDGHLMAAGDNRKQVNLWDVRDRDAVTRVGTRDGHGGMVTSIAFAPRGETMLTTSFGIAHTAMLWRDRTALSPAMITSLEHAGRVESLDVSASETLAVKASTGIARSTVASWTIADPAHPRSVTGPVEINTEVDENTVRMSAEQPTFVLAATGLWDVARKDRPRRLPPVTLANNDVSAEVRDFDPSVGLAIVSPADPKDPPLALYTTTSGHDPRKISSIPATQPVSMIFVRGRRQLVLIDARPGPEVSIALWDLTDPSRPRRIASHRLAYYSSGLAVSGDGRTITYYGSDGIRVWRPGTGTDALLVPLVASATPDQENEIQGSALSPDGSVIALSTWARTDLWSVPLSGPGSLLGTIRGHFDGSGFSPTHPILAAADGSYTNLWSLERTLATLRDPLPEACRLGGGLTAAEWPRFVKDLSYVAAC